MRTIKFRAWDKKLKKMVNVGNLSWVGDEKNFMFLVLPKDYHETQVGTDIDYPLMQFAGIKDKNGKEIYEGDIVKYLFDRGQGKEPLVSIVEWSDEFIGFPILMGCQCSNSDLEVIGNIYENKELLK